MLFIRKREGQPKATLSHKITTLPLSRDRQLVHLALGITNSGGVLLRIGEGFSAIYQMWPIPPEMEGKIGRGEDPLEDGIELGWPPLGVRDFKGIEIEPGESDEVHMEFSIPGEVKRIKAYSFVSNSEKREMGWPLTTINEVVETMVGEFDEMKKPAQQSPKPKPQPRPNTRQQKPKPKPTTPKPTPPQKPKGQIKGFS